MINQCPACDSPEMETNTLDYCAICGWEFINFVTPFDLGENLLQKRLSIARGYLQQLREGTDGIKQEISHLKNELQSVKDELEGSNSERQNLLKQNEELLADMGKTIIQGRAAQESRQDFFMQFWADDNGDIYIESSQALPRIPPMLLILKEGTLPVSSYFGNDGSYAAIVSPKRWQARQDSFVLKKVHIKSMFPCLKGTYTFSMISFSSSVPLTRRGMENESSFVTLKF